MQMLCSISAAVLAVGYVRELLNNELVRGALALLSRATFAKFEFNSPSGITFRFPLELDVGTLNTFRSSVAN